jgi:hypothetical protein
MAPSVQMSPTITASASSAPDNSAGYPVGTKITLTVVRTTSDGQRIPLQDAVWSSSNPTVAEISGNVVTARSPGTATISTTAWGTYVSMRFPVRPSAVAKVALVLAETTLVVGSATTASASLTDALGVVTTDTVTWASSNPEVATVSSSGEVVAISDGTTSISATAGSASAATEVTVTASSGTFAWTDFGSGTIAPFTNPWSGSGGTIDVIDDMTGSGRGRIARMHYAPGVGQSHELALAHVTAPLRFGKTVWMKGDVFLPSGSLNRKSTDNRKLIDFQGGGVRMTLHREGAGDLRVSIVDWMNGREEETIAESTGLTIPDDKWTAIEVRLTTNSADNLRDGVLEIYLNGSATPSYRRASGLGWITDKFVGPYGTGSYFNTFMMGFQLTNSGPVAYEEDRYWDNIGFSMEQAIAPSSVGTAND